MAIYFRARDRREVPASEALDARGCLRDGFGRRVPYAMRDAAPRFAWDAHRASDSLRVTDGRGLGGVEGCRPGFRILDSDVGRQAVADARADYIRDLESAWRTPATNFGSYPYSASASTATGAGERGARGSQEGDLCMCSGPDDEGPQGAAGHLVRRNGDLVCRADDQQQYSAAYGGRSQLDPPYDRRSVDQIAADHAAAMQRIYAVRNQEIADAWREGKTNG